MVGDKLYKPVTAVSYIFHSSLCLSLVFWKTYFKIKKLEKVLLFMLSRVYSQHLFIINQEKGVEKFHQENCALCSVMMISFQAPVSPFMNSSCLIQERYLRLREEKMCG